jgi:hypothetical protein
MAEQAHQSRGRNLWQRMNGPAKIGAIFAGLGIVLTVIGVFRDPTTPVTAWSIGMGALISGLTWGVVSWAIATAAVEVERDLASSPAESEPDKRPDESA